MQGATTARIGIGHCGGRYPTQAQLKFKEDLAVSKDAVHRDVPDEEIEKLNLLGLQSKAVNRTDYLMNIRCGRFLDNKSVELLQTKAVKEPDIQLIAADGLSSEAFSRNVPQMLPLLTERLEEEGVTLGTPLFIRWARVAIQDHVGEILRPKASLILLGERPGLGISDSLSGYFEYRPCLERVESDRNVLCNIHQKGIPPAEAALMLAEAMLRVLELKTSGMNVRFDFA